MGINIDQLPQWAQKQIADKLIAERQKSLTAQEPQKKQPKYHNQRDERTKADGAKVKFDSKREAARYDELMLMLQAGTISDLRLQHDFTLQEAYTTPDGKRVNAIRYKADFTYWKGKEFIVEDVKSKATKTRVYEMKKKLLLEKTGIAIREVF